MLTIYTVADTIQYMVYIMYSIYPGIYHHEYHMTSITHN
jgi:hypothetical protein